MILRFLRKDPERETARALYLAIVEASRRPEPFRVWGVDDTPTGRFEVLAAHMLIALRRLRAEGEAAKGFSQKVFDAFFDDMDNELRELGVGDLTVGKKIRKMAEGFYGRAGAYDAALDAGDDAALTDAVQRNIYGEAGGATGGATHFAAYLKRANAALRDQTLAALRTGAIEFPPYLSPGKAGETEALTEERRGDG